MAGNFSEFEKLKLKYIKYARIEYTRGRAFAEKKKENIKLSCQVLNAYFL